MICAGGIGLGAGLLPSRAGGRAERWVLAAYALVTGLAFGLFMNLWFWPFLGTNAPRGMGFVPGAPVSENLAHYGLFYLATSLGWDLPRGVLNAVLVLVAGPALLRVFRRGARRAAFGVPVVFEPTRAAGAAVDTTLQGTGGAR
jgi:energy-coupling factor transport system substrate-specific component